MWKTAGKPARAARPTDCTAQPIRGFRYGKKSVKSSFLPGFLRESGLLLGVAIPITRGESGRQTWEPVSFRYAVGSVSHIPPLYSRTFGTFGFYREVCRGNALLSAGSIR